ncbi:MarR family winged helix-turn-helix transcriptional regulator [Demequina soli]|uniref:MarR family winged helix-turn-helix transcriptional regulator n=1 Tax=Demequina soli TaxID=1638987 RepID=UPI000781A178|nr:MarR family transcriptional regulator [Demequina soli]
MTPEPVDRLRVAIARLNRLLKTASPAAGVSRAQESAMRVINRRGPLTTADLATYEQMRPQSMGQVVRDLVAADLVSKTPDPDDGRRELLALTDAGHATLAHASERRDAALEALLDGRLDDAQRAAIFAALPALERLGEDR